MHFRFGSHQRLDGSARSWRPSRTGWGRRSRGSRSHSVTVALVSAGVAGLLGFLVTPLEREDVVNGVTATLAWLDGRFAITRWLFGLLTAGFLVSVAILGGPLVRPRKKKGPAYRSYTKDEIYGVIWRWNWVPGSLEVREPIAYCKKCDLQLSHSPARHVDANARIAMRAAGIGSQMIYYCHNCENVIDAGKEMQMAGRAVAEIERRARAMQEGRRAAPHRDEII